MVADIVTHSVSLMFRKFIADLLIILSRGGPGRIPYNQKHDSCLCFICYTSEILLFQSISLLSVDKRQCNDISKFLRIFS